MPSNDPPANDSLALQAKRFRTELERLDPTDPRAEKRREWLADYDEYERLNRQAASDAKQPPPPNGGGRATAPNEDEASPRQDGGKCNESSTGVSAPGDDVAPSRSTGAQHGQHADGDEESGCSRRTASPPPGTDDKPWVRADQVQLERVEWLWKDRIPFGKVTMLDGDPAQGKSTVALDLAARVSTGVPMPGDCARREPAGVVIVSYEDDAADTICPRLEAAGADRSRIAIFRLDQTPMIPDGLTQIREAIAATNAKFLVIDPLMAGLSARKDAHRDQDVRQALKPLASLAAETGVAVLVIRHRVKGEVRNAVTAGMGSIGIVGAARAGLLAAFDPDFPGDSSRHVVASTKANLGPLAPSLCYRTTEVMVGDGVRTGKIDWGAESPLSADDIIARSQLPRSHGGRASKVTAATDHMRRLLAVGPRSAKDVEAALHNAGFSDYAIKEAKADVGVVSSHVGDGPNGQWWWRLPNADGT